MKKARDLIYLSILFYLAMVIIGDTVGAQVQREWDNIYDIPDMPEDTKLSDNEKKFAYRGRIGYFLQAPSSIGCYFDTKVNYVPAENIILETKLESDNESVSDSASAEPVHKTGKDYFGDDIADKEIWHENESLKVMYRMKPIGASFCGAYIMIMGDLSQYSVMTFMLKGANGGESFRVGMNDSVSNKREDMVCIGSINRFLPGCGSVTRDWQIVRIPMKEFYGPDIKQVFSLTFDINEETSGTFWIDDLRFYRDDPLDMPDISEIGYLLLDNFDYSYLNLLGRKTNTYKKLPSLCSHTLDKDVFYGEKGKSLRIDYDKRGTGWCGYFSLLNQIDGEWYDLSKFDRVSFMVKGKKGGENFTIGLADKSWVIIGDSLKAGTVNQYLNNGVTTEWQEVVIPLCDFGLLDLTEMGSFVIDFHRKQKGTIWIDDLKFLLKDEQGSQDSDWDELF